MATLRAKLVEQWVEEEIIEAPPASIYDQRYGNASEYPDHQYLPHCMYFFYMRLNDDGALKVDHYFYHRGPPEDPSSWPKISREEARALVPQLAMKARPLADMTPSPLPDHNFENIRLTRKSYVAFFFDEANWAYHRQKDGKFAMAYNRDKAGGAENFSFFDAEDIAANLPISRGGADRRTGVVLINHMKSDAAGTDLENQGQEFAFDMYFDVEFADPTDNKLTVIFDPGGTNQGPPETP